MSHAAALDRLMSLGGELHTPQGEPRRKFDLAHMRALLAALGDPQKRFRSVLIAGTNGKGSTAATLASIMAASGYRVGLYTSPHLSRINERIRISAAPGAALLAELEDSALFEHLARVEAAATRLVADGTLPGPPSFFETMTAIAMLAFAAPPELLKIAPGPVNRPDPVSGSGSEVDARFKAAPLPVDLAILEVGLGGRLDATNVVEPLLSIITDISLDHTEWLGPTIAAIAREKAGILRPGGTMITLPQHPEANQALGEVAVALDVRGVNAADYLPGREAPASGENQYVLSGLSEAGGLSLVIDSPLRGQHQQRNLALAIAAAIELRNSHGYILPRDQIERGIRETRWSGRLELLPPKPGRPAILLDVAHNPAGAWALRAALSQLVSPGPRLLIFGCMRDKAFTEIAQILFPIFDHVYLTDLPSPRAASIADLALAAERTGTPATTCANPKAALDAAIDAVRLQPEPAPLIVAGGSVILIGALRTLLL